MNLYRVKEGVIIESGRGAYSDDFTLQHGDEIGINIEPIGTLVNFVETGTKLN